VGLLTKKNKVIGELVELERKIENNLVNKYEIYPNLARIYYLKGVDMLYLDQKIRAKDAFDHAKQFAQDSKDLLEEIEEKLTLTTN